MDALASALSFASSASLSPAVVQWRSKLQREFTTFLESAAPSVTMASCSHQHVLVFLHGAYVPTHGGRSPGSRPSPATLDTVIDTLGTIFNQMGRKLDNPVKHHTVSSYRKSYYTRAREEGQWQKSATPISESKMVSCINNIERDLWSIRDPIEHVRSRRDIALFAFLWATQCRMADTSTLAAERVYALGHTDSPIFADPFAPCFLFNEGLLLLPTSDKSHHYERAPSKVLRSNDPGSALAIRLLRAYFMARAWAKVPFSGPLFPASDSSGRALSDEPMTTTALNAAIKRRFETLGVWQGETSYSFKRGSMQADAAAGKSNLDISMKSGVMTPKQLHKYLDPGRHLKPTQCNSSASGQRM